jgi:hypothetical protein
MHLPYRILKFVADPTKGSCFTSEVYGGKGRSTPRLLLGVAWSGVNAKTGRAGGTFSRSLVSIRRARGRRGCLPTPLSLATTQARQRDRPDQSATFRPARARRFAPGA